MKRLRYYWKLIKWAITHRNDKENRQKKRRMNRDLDKERRKLRLHKKVGG